MIFRSPNLICSFSKKPFNLSLEYGDTRDALADRKKFLEQLGINPEDLICARQVHGCGIRHIQEPDRGRGAVSLENAIAQTDAMITNQRNLPLAVFTADCLSIFLYDPVASSIGIVHAGWRSTKEKIVVKTIQLMQKKFSTLLQNLYVGFGPCIRQCCYRVGEEFQRYFPDDIVPRGADFYLDLAGANKRQILGLGIEDKKINDSGICTSCKNAEFFSYRREGPSCGRMISVIMLR